MYQNNPTSSKRTRSQITFLDDVHDARIDCRCLTLQLPWQNALPRATAFCYPASRPCYRTAQFSKTSSRKSDSNSFSPIEISNEHFLLRLLANATPLRHDDSPLHQRTTRPPETPLDPWRSLPFYLLSFHLPPRDMRSLDLSLDFFSQILVLLDRNRNHFNRNQKV